ncbi:MAG: hypothetical protein ACJAWL_000816 [Motiliproteus sp.]|jgi:hypothetical protein
MLLGLAAALFMQPTAIAIALAIVSGHSLRRWQPWVGISTAIVLTLNFLATRKNPVPEGFTALSISLWVVCPESHGWRPGRYRHSQLSNPSP